MRRISSKLTFYYKRIFPVIFFGALSAMFAATVFGAFAKGDSPGTGFAFLPMLLVAGIGYYAMRKLVFDLVDEVFETGDGLVVRNAGREDKIAFSDVINVGYAPLMNPPRVTLLLRRPSLFGDRVTFVAPLQWMPFAASPVIDELIHRIDAKRGAATMR